MRLYALFVAAGAAAASFLLAAAAPPTPEAITRAATYVQSQQQSDGGYGTAGAGAVADAVFALRSAGFDPNKDVVAGKTPADYLRANASAQDKPAAAAKMALAARALGLDPRAVGGVDLVARVTAAYTATTGRYAEDDFSHSVAVLGLVCTDNGLGADALGALQRSQNADGSWGFDGAGDPDTTAIAVQALRAAGLSKSDPALARALTYIRSSQGIDGGWGFDPSASNVSSTAYMVQALLALGELPDSAAYTRDGATPSQFLLSQQNADGSFKGFDALFATNQALPALAGRTFCNAPDTPVTRVRAAPTATPAISATATPAPATASPSPATALPTATASGPTAPAPAPPHTGSGSASEPRRLELIIVGAALLAIGAGTVTFRRCR
ncbi:MAG: hypothetical protein IT304_07680 [Dehalococcoidia bacterium]|nr:hypothetical protein [Dehalococcoidia bacterium]